MKFAISFDRVPNTPPTLERTLEQFKQDQAFKEGGKALLKKIQDFEQGLIDGTDADDLSIISQIGRATTLSKDVHLNAFIGYMGLTFFWQGQNRLDFAWHYYAQAQYYLGLHEGFFEASEQLEALRIRRENQGRGKSQSNEAKRRILVDALISAAKNPPGLHGWTSKKDFMNHATPILEEVIDKEELENFQSKENLESAIYRYLRNYEDAYNAYVENSAPGNKDRSNKKATAPNQKLRMVFKTLWLVRAEHVPGA